MTEKVYQIEHFEKSTTFIQGLQELINNKYEHLFYAVIAHGSVGTNEIIKYSDFDGLLIVKDSFIASKKLESFKKESMKLILKFDPLQHHGWFQIKESQLQNYPQNYLPHEVLEYSKLIFPKNNAIKVRLNYNENIVNYKQSLNQLIISIENQSKVNFKSERLYNLKSFLSKVMLLPSMYYSAKNDEGIFKKYSFESVKGDFSFEEWMCMTVATQIRNNWNYSLTPFQKYIMTRPEKLFRRLTKKYVSPKINDEINKELSTDFFKSVNLFIKRINKDIFAK